MLEAHQAEGQEAANQRAPCFLIVIWTADLCVCLVVCELICYAVTMVTLPRVSVPVTVRASGLTSYQVLLGDVPQFRGGFTEPVQSGTDRKSVV